MELSPSKILETEAAQEPPEEDTVLPACWFWSGETDSRFMTYRTWCVELVTKFVVTVLQH